MVKDFKSYKDLNIIVTVTTYSKNFFGPIKNPDFGRIIYGVRA